MANENTVVGNNSKIFGVGIFMLSFSLLVVLIIWITMKWSAIWRQISRIIELSKGFSNELIALFMCFFFPSIFVACAFANTEVRRWNDLQRMAKLSLSTLIGKERMNNISTSNSIESHCIFGPNINKKSNISAHWNFILISWNVVY